MNLCLINHSFKYELEKLIRIFMPFEKIEFFNTEKYGESCAITILDKENNCVSAELCILGKTYKKTLSIVTDIEVQDNEYELKLATALYDCFVQATGYIPQWGLLTGVRPAKLFSRFSKEYGQGEAEKYFKDIFLVSDKKISLCNQTVCGENQIISLSKKNSFSLYISIPFCPTRCSYCSFVSHSIQNAKKLIPQYVKLLCEELRYTGKITSKLKLKLETIYIGGGTPTAISTQQIADIMETVRDSFNLSELKEYTVEAGRPDTITAEKLLAIKNGGATRISINPQTMNNEVLETIGRKHTAEQTVNAFKLAQELGFKNINMDLIAGLPTDTFESFKKTLEQVIKLNPQSVTVHALSMKRSSNMTKCGELPEIEAGKTADMMVDYARLRLTEEGIIPYYMYRQSKTVGNLENVGYARKGFECLYNVYIMDETHTILACGASAVTKLREPSGNYIERIFNYKYPYEYIDGFDEMINRKEGVLKFYDKFGYRNK